MPDRMVKINELIRRSVAKELQKHFPQYIFSINQVSVSKDLAYAKIWVSASNDAEKVSREFNNFSAELRKLIAGDLELRKTPRLRFVPDHTSERADEIEKLLDSIKEDEQNKS